MNPFRSYTYSWWQMGILKFALLAIGVIVGAYLSSFVLGAVWVFITIALAGSAYIMVISLTGKKKTCYSLPAVQWQANPLGKNFVEPKRLTTVLHSFV